MADELDFGDKQVASLVVTLMQRNAQEAAWLSNSITKSLQDDLDEARAELKAVRNRITDLCRKPWTPSTHAIMAALYGEEWGDGPYE